MKANIEQYTNKIFICGTRTYYRYSYAQAKKRIAMLRLVDPTKDKQKYINWLIMLDVNGISKFPEDSVDINCSLHFFDTVKKSKDWMYPRDIFGKACFIGDRGYPITCFETAGSLARCINNYRRAISSEDRRTIILGNTYRETIVQNIRNWVGSIDRIAKITELPCQEHGDNFIVPHCEWIYAVDRYKVIRVYCPDAGEILFKNSKWCVRFKENFHRYKPPYYLFLKDDIPYMLCDETSQQMKDVWNNRISQIQWKVVEPILKELGLKFKLKRGEQYDMMSLDEISTVIATNTVNTLNSLSQVTL